MSERKDDITLLLGQRGDCFEKAVAIRRHRLPAGDPRIEKSQTALEEMAGRTTQ